MNRDQRPPSLTEEDAQRLQAEHSQSPVVEAARVVEFVGTRSVHLDLNDGGLVVINGKEALHIEK